MTWAWICMMSLLGGAMLATTISAQVTNLSGTNGWVNVHTLEKVHGLTLTEIGTNGLSLSSNNVLFECKAGSRAVKASGTLVYLNGPVLKTSNGWFVARVDLEENLLPLVAFLGGGNTNSKMTGRVLLDPGHGGVRDGAKVGDVREKDLNLDVVKRLTALLKAKGLKVHLTRSGDEDVTLEARPAMLATTKSDFLVSVHFNQAERAATSGIETFVFPATGFPSTSDPMEPAQTDPWKEQPANAYNSESLVLAFGIHQALINATGAIDRGVKRARFAVLRTATAPAILVECGFLSNAGELAKIMDPAYRELLAKTLAEQIIHVEKHCDADKP